MPASPTASASATSHSRHPTAVAEPPLFGTSAAAAVVVAAAAAAAAAASAALAKGGRARAQSEILEKRFSNSIPPAHPRPPPPSTHSISPLSGIIRIRIRIRIRNRIRNRSRISNISGIRNRTAAHNALIPARQKHTCTSSSRKALRKHTWPALGPLHSHLALIRIDPHLINVVVWITRWQGDRCIVLQPPT